MNDSFGQRSRHLQIGVRPALIIEYGYDDVVSFSQEGEQLSIACVRRALSESEGANTFERFSTETFKRNR